MLTRRDVLLMAAAVGLATLFVRLGMWQLSRYAERSATNAARATRGAEPALDWTAGTDVPADTTGLVWRRVRLRGRYDPEREVVLRGRTLGGRPGVEVATPLVVGDEGVLVIRGWLPAADALRADLASGWPGGERPEEVVVEGTLVPSAEGRGGQPLTVESAGIEHLALAGADLEVIGDRLPYPVAPHVVRAESGGPGAAILERPPEAEPDAGPHLPYAVQWFAFAAISIVGTAILIGKERGERER